jgi:NAD(P)-dependent dehydrogenase (short-subunit alcohol dehydrogenase family)/rhamnose utilization protein RhaD (predicted bifunctional aldolase and dehydrogenase)
MDKALAELIKISKAVGKDSTFVQGGGGNTSVKTSDGKYMYIKASGTALKDMNEQNGWRRLRLDMVLAIIKDNSIAQLDAQRRETEVVNRLLPACDDKVTSPSGRTRPSVEAHLHAFLDKCVIHLHPSAVGAFVNAKNGRAELEKIFKDESTNGRPLLWVSYTDPGFMLAKKIMKLINDYQDRFGKKPAILFLEKHGLLVSANSSNAALRLVRRVINRCNSKLKQPKRMKIKSVSEKTIADTKLDIRKAFFEATGRYTMISHFCNDAVAAFWRQRDAQRMLFTPALTPDELVYANGPAMWVDKCKSKKVAGRLISQINKAGKPSVAFLVKGVGLFIVGTEKIALTIRDITTSSFFIRTNADRMGGIIALNKRQQNFINQWESEAFRKKLAGGANQGMLQERIAVVTGAGSGLGKSIAIGLARAGAAVGLADIDTKAAEQTHRIIKSELPDASAMVLGCNVTDETSVRKTFEALLDNWGGLDIMVNAAGVAPAAQLVDMPVDKWRLALEVNLTGYFLMARAAARIMIQQAIGGGIINISSKSALEASRNNTPYNATKAGEIHMARGWALELGKYGIRVNSICPGNVFEGSKIWNPRYMKVCARKYGIKPQEVVSYYVSKTALKREIKGQDIADAVVFLCSDKARTITGQTLVADAGQVMVR